MSSEKGNQTVGFIYLMALFLVSLLPATAINLSQMVYLKLYYLSPHEC